VNKLRVDWSTFIVLELDVEIALSDRSPIVL
jgi:hypothetical protein